jgi:hypothetical protein
MNRQTSVVDILEINPVFEHQRLIRTSNELKREPRSDFAKFLDFIFFLNCLVYTVLDYIHDNGNIKQKLLDHPFWTGFDIVLYCMLYCICGGFVYGIFGNYSAIIVNGVLLSVNYMLLLEIGIDPQVYLNKIF